MAQTVRGVFLAFTPGMPAHDTNQLVADCRCGLELLRCRDHAVALVPAIANTEGPGLAPPAPVGIPAPRHESSLRPRPFER